MPFSNYSPLPASVFKWSMVQLDTRVEPCIREIYDGGFD